MHWGCDEGSVASPLISRQRDESTLVRRYASEWENCFYDEEQSKVSRWAKRKYEEG